MPYQFVRATEQADAVLPANLLASPCYECHAKFVSYFDVTTITGH